ncbi:MAG TPA: hypothetical protein VGG59_07600 [Acidobacteriaceae bacterium]|jgi:hypothetical protein
MSDYGFIGDPSISAAFEIRSATADPLVTIHMDGRVELNPAIPVDEAARAFWNAVQRVGMAGERIYAWIGEDELGSGRIGIKQGQVPAGYIPLAAMDYDFHKLVRLKPQMEAQAAQYGKKIRLCKFVMTEVAAATEAGT